MPSDWDPKRLEYLRAKLQEKGHRFEGFPLRCIGCGVPIGVLSAIEEAAPTCLAVERDNRRTEG